MLYRSAVQDTVKIRILNEIGRKYYRAGMPDSAIAYFGKSLKLKSVNDVERWEILSYLGVCHVMKGTHPLALNYYLQSLAVARALGDSLRVGGAYRGIADSYSRLNKPETAVLYYDKAIRYLKEQPGAFKEYAIALNNKANNLRRAGRYREALEIYENNRARLEQALPEQGVANAYEEIGICYTYLKEYPEAEKYLLKSLELAGTSPDDLKLLVTIYYSLADLYFRWDGKTEAAKRYGLQAFELSRKNNFDTVLLSASELIYKMYKAEGNREKALYFHEVFMEVKDKNYKIEQEKAEQAVRMEYENSIVKEQNLRQSERIQLQERLQYMLVGFLLVLSLLFVLLYRSRKKISRQQQMIQEKNEELAGFNRKLEQRVIEKTRELDAVNRDLVRLNNELVESIVKGQTIERKRVAAELHDNLGSQLVALKWLYGNLESETDRAEFDRKYGQIRELIDRSYRAVREISHNMLPEEFEENGLAGATVRLLDNVNGSGKIKFRADFSSYNGLERKKEFEIYHILMELTTNTLKHSRGHEVLLVAESTGASEACIQYHEDTPGNPYIENREGKGMKNIEDRALLIRAKISLRKTVINGKEFNSFILTV